MNGEPCLFIVTYNKCATLQRLLLVSTKFNLFFISLSSLYVMILTGLISYKKKKKKEKRGFSNLYCFPLNSIFYCRSVISARVRKPITNALPSLCLPLSSLLVCLHACLHSMLAQFTLFLFLFLFF